MATTQKTLESLAKLGGEAGDWGGFGPDVGRHDFRNDEFRTARLEMARIVREAFPSQTEALDWKGLKRYLLADNTYRWLCPIHKPE